MVTFQNQNLTTDQKFDQLFIFISKSAVGNWVVIILLAIVALAVQQLTIIGAIWTSPTALAMVSLKQLLFSPEYIYLIIFIAEC